jgi:site-specific recombinase XerD
MAQDLALIPAHIGVGVHSSDRLQRYLDNARARNTITGYKSSYRQFKSWCDAAGLVGLPASDTTIALYISAQAEKLRASTLQHHLAAIAKAHRAAGLPSPMADSLLVAETLKGIKRTNGIAPERKAPVLTEDLRVMLRLTGQDPAGARDRALLLIGFAGVSKVRIGRVKCSRCRVQTRGVVDYVATFEN